MVFEYVFYTTDSSFDYNGPFGSETQIEREDTGFRYDPDSHKIEGFGDLEKVIFKRHDKPIKTLCEFLAQSIYWHKISIDDVTKMRNETGIINIAQEYLIEKMVKDITVSEDMANTLYEMEREGKYEYLSKAAIL